MSALTTAALPLALLSLAAAHNDPTAAAVATSATEVFVMLPLDLVDSHGSLLEPDRLTTWLERLRSTNVTGVMADCWWGRTEPDPGQYDFRGYQKLVALVKRYDFKLQLVTSFHMCGSPGGVGTYIPLPDWVTSETGLWYTDAHGIETKGYISLWADDKASIKGRTPLQIYSDWMAAFKRTFAADIGLNHTIVELMVGLGTDGELKYPAYENGPSSDPWQWPGIGEFQCYDQHALADLAAAARRAGRPPSWGVPPSPTLTGGYNSRWNETEFFTAGYRTEQGRFFLEWYAEALEHHADSMLQIARDTFGPAASSSVPVSRPLRLSAKVAGIHWMYRTPSHAAELTAGYYNANGIAPYRRLAQLFGKHSTTLDFTCMEMTDVAQSTGSPTAFSAPQELVQQVANAAGFAKIPLAGENALNFYDVGGYNQLLSLKPELYALTYLRMGPTLMDQPTNLALFGEFVRAMQGPGFVTPFSLGLPAPTTRRPNATVLSMGDDQQGHGRRSMVSSQYTSMKTDDFERHRPIFHLTPRSGHNNDPNGLFYDSVHDMYHVAVQWNSKVKGGGAGGWYWFTSRDLVSWTRLGIDPVHNVSSCSGGAVIAPDGTPTLIFCNGQTAVPINRSDPHLRQWAQNSTVVTAAAWMPYRGRGQWDASATWEPTRGRFVLTYGSCHMMPGANDTTSCGMNTSTPSVLSFSSDNLESWTYLGDVWTRSSNEWHIPGFTTPMHVPRTECPYQWQHRRDAGTTFIKVSAPGAGRDYIYVGKLVGNGSRFIANLETNAGIMLDWGQIYASAVLDDTKHNRTLLWGWVLNQYDFSKTDEPPFDGALSLPRVMDIDPETSEPTWEIAPEVVKLRIDPPIVTRHVKVPPGGSMALDLPDGVAGDAIEIMLNVSSANASEFGLSVRATAAGVLPVEQTTLYYSQETGLELNGTSADPMASACSCWLCDCNVFVAPPLPQRLQGKGSGHTSGADHSRHTLRVFVDKSVVEVHLNARLSVTSRAYPLSSEATHTFLINRGTKAVEIESVAIWGMRSIWLPASIK